QFGRIRFYRSFKPQHITITLQKIKISKRPEKVRLTQILLILLEVGVFFHPSIVVKEIIDFPDTRIINAASRAENPGPFEPAVKIVRYLIIAVVIFSKIPVDRKRSIIVELVNVRFKIIGRSEKILFRYPVHRRSRQKIIITCAYHNAEY